jgi:hypothetical protein
MLTAGEAVSLVVIAVDEITPDSRLNLHMEHTEINLVANLISEATAFHDRHSLVYQAMAATRVVM